MTGIKTGNKGFINPADDNKVYTMDSVPEGEPGINKDPPAYDPGNMTVDNSVKDIGKKTRITLGAYLSKVTKGEVGSSITPNKYTIDNPTDSSEPSKISTNGYPTPLGRSDNSSQFKDVLPSSFSKDYATIAGSIKKGRSDAQGVDGNDLLAKADVTNGTLQGPKPLADYTKEAIKPNRIVPGVGSFSKGENIESPSKNFNVALQSEAAIGTPGQEVSTSSKYELDLAAATEKPYLDTLSAKNDYPVSKPDVSNLSSISSADGKYPAPLTPPVNVNASVHAGNIGDSMSDAYPTIVNLIKKGKANEPGIKDGNELLTKGVVTDSQGNTKLDYSLNTYTNTNLKKNDQTPSSPLLPPEIDPTSPPASFHPRLADVSTPGSHTGAPHGELSLEQLRKLPWAVTGDNSYPIDKNAYELDSTTTEGTPTPLANSKNDDRFVDNNEVIKPSSKDASLTNFSKGKSLENSKYDGHNLLPKIVGNHSVGSPRDKYSKTEEEISAGRGAPPVSTVSRGNKIADKTPEDHPIKSYKGDRGSSTLALGNNRFAPGFGLHSTPAKFNPTLRLPEDGPEGRPVTMMEMAQIGAGLSQRASAEIPGYLQGTFNPNSDIAELGAQLPSVVQAGILKVNNVILEAKDMLNSLEGSFPTNSLTEIAPFGDQSWGVMNNVSEPFDDPTNIGFMITMLLMMIAIRLLMELFALPSLAANNKSIKQEDNGQRKLGSYMFEEPNGLSGLLPFDLYEVFGIKRTVNGFHECLRSGFNSFFLGSHNADTSEGQLLFGALGIGLDSLIGEGQAVGYNLGICRTIVRSGLVLAIALDRVIRSPNIVSGVKSAIGIFRIIKSSKLMSAYNVFATLGDAILERNKLTVLGTLSPGDSGISVGPKDKKSDLSVSTIDTFNANEIPHSTVIKSRAGTDKYYSPILAWSSQRAPSMYLVPQKVQNIINEDGKSNNPLGSFRGGASLESKEIGKRVGDKKQLAAREHFVEGGTGRLPNDVRIAYEEALDAEYVPFSFHDVRTNEIISFHAFLNNLTDDYSSQYDSFEGFGRIEPVKVYKGTTRKITMSFIVASTSENDFDRMWVKINKLLTMVYPQYTRGRDLLGDNYAFRAPFSQLVGASPLIRIRLGDLIRSNYSRFALARLFGMADGDTELPDANGNSARIDLSKRGSVEQNQRISAQASTFTVGEEVIVSDDVKNEILIKIQKATVAAQAAALAAAAPSAPPTTKPSKPSGPVKKEQAEVLPAGPPQQPPPAPEVKFYIASTPASGTSYTIEAKIGDAVKETFNADQSAISKTEAALAAIRSDVLGPDGGVPGFDALTNFMSPENNAIVKSFESAGGKGLAGFIESMNFDWMQQTAWSVDPGRTAPKMCKVSLTFAPVHDITPGIDHQGYNRAPVYPVGAGMISAPSSKTPT